MLTKHRGPGALKEKQVCVKEGGVVVERVHPSCILNSKSLFNAVGGVLEDVQPL